MLGPLSPGTEADLARGEVGSAGGEEAGGESPGPSGKAHAVQEGKSRCSKEPSPLRERGQAGGPHWAVFGDVRPPRTGKLERRGRGAGAGLVGGQPGQRAETVSRRLTSDSS